MPVSLRLTPPLGEMPDQILSKSKCFERSKRGLELDRIGHQSGSRQG